MAAQVITVHISVYLILTLFCCRALKPPTMAGEPLNPTDYEKGSRLVMNPEIENDMAMNDGTMDDILEQRQILRGISSSSVQRWPNAIVPYMLDSAFNDDERAMIAKAIQLIQESTCVRIISRTTQKDYVLVRKNINSTSCSSFVGMVGGKQRLNLASRCIQRVGSTAHEFMHAIGFYHEQSRPDRDKHVMVFHENILEGSESNFMIRRGEYGNLEGPYDTMSITHYSRTAFSKNGKDTMIPVKNNGNGQLGQRIGLTEKDIDKINEFYKCGDEDYPESDEDEDDSETDEEDEEYEDYEEFETSRSKTKDMCRDFNQSDCKLWAQYGYCEKSPMLMPVFCRKMCKKCGMGCVDMNKRCREWSAKKYCAKYSDYMHHYCAFSCKTCP